MKVLAILMSWSLLMFSSAVFADENLGDGVESDTITFASPANHGVPVCTAAVPADGVIKKCFNCSKATSGKIGVGTYEVKFRGQCKDVRSSSGYYRYVQVDTLTIGSLPARSCITADRAGSNNGVWVVCHDAAGAAVDTPFLLTVTR